MGENGKIKAVGLFSGGLDSLLAVKIIQDMNIAIYALNVRTVFAGREWEESFSQAERLAKTLGVPLNVMTVSDEFIEIVKRPRYGHGKNMNPCIDCHIFMLEKAKEYVDEIGAQFVFTGEVVGQRPMSQHKPQLRQIEKVSGLEGLLLRPLSARLLPPTIPENNGWVNRDRLLGLSGRSRKAQIELAAKYGITDYPTPAGGCLLTDAVFSARLRDLFDHGVDDINSCLLLKVGRHFRISDTAKCVIGRNEKENIRIAHLVQDGDYLFDTEGVGSPLGLLLGAVSKRNIEETAALCKFYSDGKSDLKVCVKVWKVPEKKCFFVSPSQLTQEDAHEKIIRL